MAEMKRRKRTKSYTKVGARVGKADTTERSSGTDTALAGSKYRAGGAKNKSRKGGIIRKPAPKIRYSKPKS